MTRSMSAARTASTRAASSSGPAWPSRRWRLRACLAAAGVELTGVVEWRVLCDQGASLREGFAAFAAWPGDAAPPAVTVAIVAGLAVPGALVEIAATAPGTPLTWRVPHLSVSRCGTHRAENPDSPC